MRASRDTRVVLIREVLEVMKGVLQSIENAPSRGGKLAIEAVRNDAA